MSETPDPHQLARWRLVLGKQAEQHGVGLGGDEECQRIEGLVGFLFDESQQQDGSAASPPEDRSGGSGPSAMNIPTWIDGVAELFPRSAKEVMERELVQRRGIAELMDQPKLLEKIEPNVDLVKTILTHKDLLNPKTRILARKIIQKVVDQLKEKMKIQVEAAITGAIRREKFFATWTSKPRCDATSLTTTKKTNGCSSTAPTFMPRNATSDHGTS